MKYKTAFRLAMRAIGIFLIAENIPWVVVSCGSIALVLLEDSLFGATSGFVPWNFQTGAVHLLGVLLGLYLFFGGAWIVNRAIPSNRPYCHECGYEITGLPAEGVCPECGTGYRRGKENIA